ncbi:PASTA domain-containing protein [bacterium]|nr:PASTA domain-containing protein [bacterium]
MMSESRKKGFLRKVAFYAFIIITAFLVGIVIFNSFIIPKLVGRGDIVLVPEIRGLSVESARSKCSNAGYNLKITAREHSAEIPGGAIISQIPQPGEGLKERRTIQVIVSAGQKMIVVPDLEGESLRQAWLTLQGMGIRRGKVSRVFSYKDSKNSVIGLSPCAGSEVPVGSQVDLLFSIYGISRTFLMPDLVGMDMPFVKDRLERLGFKIGRIVNKRAENGFPNTILAQSPVVGSAIKEGEAVEITVSTVK